MRVDTLAEDLDDILCRWYAWQQIYRPVRAWKSKSLVCGDYKSGRWADPDDGYGELEKRAMKAVDFAVEKMPDHLRAAIHQEARNVSVGSQLFVHPRLPADPERRQQIVAEARDQLTRLLQVAGVL